MSNNVQQKWEIKQADRETEAYKMFMHVAKRMSRLEYKVWTIAPDISDPLRKFTLTRNIGWATLQFTLVMEPFYHRNGEWNNRGDFRAMIGVKGLFASEGKDVTINTRLKLRPRMAKKLIQAVNEVIIPKFYAQIEEYKKSWEQQRLSIDAFAQNIAKVKGLSNVGKPQQRMWGEPQGKLANCPFTIDLTQKNVGLNATMTYDDFAKLAEANKWGDYK